MKIHRTFIALSVLAAAVLRAQAPHDPIAANLFPPEFIMANADAIHFTEEQRQGMQEIMEKARQQFDELQEAMKREAGAFGQLLAQATPDNAAILAQFDKLQDRERAIKRAQLTLMLGMRGKLTPEQRTALTELRAKNPGAQPTSPAVLQEKAGRVQNGVARWTEEGRDPTPIGELMNQIDPLLRVGKMHEAEAILDQALKLLGKDAKGN